MIDFKERIARLCNLHTGLADADIVRLTEIAESFEMSNGQDDVFIDVLSSVANQAIVVYHYRPDSGKSLYRRSVRGRGRCARTNPAC